jgi:hypothetical protein
MSQAITWTRPPSCPASASSISPRRPEIATTAPLACIARAIAAPIPPVAPLTSAVLSVRSNMMFSSRLLVAGEIQELVRLDALQSTGRSQALWGGV